MMKKTSFLMVMAVLSVSACGRQSTPSMMNTSLPRLEEGTTLQQMPVADVSSSYLHKLAQEYNRYGNGPIQLTLVHDPKSYKKMQAFDDLATFKQTLAKMNVRNVKGEVLEASNMEPTLMVSYDAVTAKAPDGCYNMPGMDTMQTTREIGDYRFGCTVDTALAKQIYRPADLAGNDGADDIDGRRAANAVEYDRQITPQEADGELRVFSRQDIQN